MLWEALGAAALGLALAYAAALRLPARLPNRPLALATGPAGALIGGLICRVVLGPGHVLATLTAAACVCVATLSLLVSENSRPTGLRHSHAKMPSPPRV